MLDVSGMVLAAAGLARLRTGALALDACTPQKVEVISGAFMLVRRTLWERLGGFDERFFMYTEEVDLCKRIANAGYELWADPSIVMIHDAGSGDPDNPRKRLQNLRGNATFYRKHYPPIAASIGCIAMLANETIRLIYARTLLRAIKPMRAKSLGDRCAYALQHRAEWWMAGRRHEVRLNPDSIGAALGDVGDEEPCHESSRTRKLRTASKPAPRSAAVTPAAVAPFIPISQ